MIKLCVGAEGVEDLSAWQTARLADSGAANPVHVTRMRPKRAEELVSGGSLYWVFKGQVLARQQIIRLDEVTRADGGAACAIVLGREIIRTATVPRRPFQGWRYLAPDDAPPDLHGGAEDGAPEMPHALRAALADLGVA
ncbi:MAG: hypothetical protein ACI9ZH_001281 [Paracoccaceae bacterium]|jgi:hypothetical protein